MHRESPAQTPSRKIVSAYRGYNRRRWRLERDTAPLDERAPFICECTSDACVKPVALTMHEFEAAHRNPTWCAVRPGHILPDDGGKIVLQEPHFWVVEMTPLP